MKYITYTTVRLKCLSPPKRIHPGTCAVSPRALPKGWRAVGPRPHASLSNPDESPHCPVHTAGFLPLVRIVDPDHPWRAASQASMVFPAGEDSTFGGY